MCVGSIRNLEALVSSLNTRLQQGNVNIGRDNSDTTRDINMFGETDTASLSKVLSVKETQRYISMTTKLRTEIDEILIKLSACIHLIDGNTLLNHCNIAKTLNKVKKTKVEYKSINVYVHIDSHIYTCIYIYIYIYVLVYV